MSELNSSRLRFILNLLFSFAFAAASHADLVSPVGIVESSNSNVPSNAATNLYDGKTSTAFTAKRINNRLPIISKQTFMKAGFRSEDFEAQNINGPSIIRIPDWIPSHRRADRTAVYYMYFAHHKGKHIRMAWAADIEGPYTLYNSIPGQANQKQGVLGMHKVSKRKYYIDIGNGIRLNNHVASPDVLVDDENRKIIMYFHAPSDGYVATSDYGLDFNGKIEPYKIADQYMRIFEWRGDLYASKWSDFYKAPSLHDPWTPTRIDFVPQEDYIWERAEALNWKQYFIDTFADSLTDSTLDPTAEKALRIRHTDILVEGDTLHVFYSRKGDMPERILHTAVQMDPDFNNWTLGETMQEILIPQEDWEGIQFPITRSQGGSDDDSVRELRDPDVFVDLDGKMYLAYSGQGEDAIGLATLTMDHSIASTGDSWISHGLDQEPQYAILDLGKAYTIEKITLYPHEQRDYQYTIQLSDTPSEGFTTIVDRSENQSRNESISDNVNEASGRYLRLEIQGAATFIGNDASIDELEIKGTPTNEVLEKAQEVGTKEAKARAQSVSASVAIGNQSLIGKAKAIESPSNRGDAKGGNNKTNVIMIMADDIGYECYGVTGGQGFVTPRLDKMAAEGMLFTHTYSNPMCTPTRNKLMTGLSGIRNYVDFGILHKDTYTFGNMMQEAGYRTALAGKWQLNGSYKEDPSKSKNQGRGAHPNRVGFEDYAVWQLESRGNRYFAPTLTINGKTETFDEQKFGPDICSDFLMDRMQEYTDDGDPFFIYYPMIIPHSPTDPTPDNLIEYETFANNEAGKLKKFQDQVAYMDKIIGRIVDKTVSLGIAENTLILVVGDNGKSKGVVSYHDEKRFPGGKGSYSDAGTRVALFAYQPGTVKAMGNNDSLIDFADFFPTIAEAADIDLKQPTDGISFHPILRGEVGNPRETVFVYYCKNPKKRKREIRFARTKQYKLYRDEKGEGDLYDVQNDSFEETPLNKDEHPAVLAQLRAVIASYPPEGQALWKFD